jgi:hypothetical protein
MPTIGDRSSCQTCGHKIEYVGPYWRHVGCSPRHPGVPADPVTLPVGLREDVLSDEAAAEIQKILDDQTYPTHAGKEMPTADASVLLKSADPTELPWRVVGTVNGYMVMSPDEKTVEELRRDGQAITRVRVAVLEASHYTPVAVALANAKFIVRACNNHESLLGAARLAFDALRSFIPPDKFDGHCAYALLKLTDAIRKAEEKS